MSNKTLMKGFLESRDEITVMEALEMIKIFEIDPDLTYEEVFGEVIVRSQAKETWEAQMSQNDELKAIRKTLETIADNLVHVGNVLER